ncbi:hypothetical protein MRB53_041424 [Persea americana]|nr:hypothetical protein MRB53_041424 [Persea americana]
MTIVSQLENKKKHLDFEACSKERSKFITSSPLWLTQRTLYIIHFHPGADTDGREVIRSWQHLYPSSVSKSAGLRNCHPLSQSEFSSITNIRHSHHDMRSSDLILLRHQIDVLERQHYEMQ